jgi:hypothetical protein
MGSTSVLSSRTGGAVGEGNKGRKRSPIGGLGVVGLVGLRGWPLVCPYGTIGVAMVRLIRSALPKRGTRTSVARTALCKRIEIASARRLTRRSRVRCSASPSTRHPLSDPRLSLELTFETLRGSDDITHLHIFSASLHRPVLSQNGNTEDFAAPISWGLL